jgi:hypothetical protein
MLIMISVSGAALLYTYASGLLGPLQGAQGQQNYLEHIALEYYNWQTNPLQIRIRNVGSHSIQIQDIFISGIMVNPNSITWGVAGDVCQGQSGFPLLVQSSCLVQIAPPSSFTASAQLGVAYSVSFVSSTGTKTSFSVIYGQTG